MASGAGRYGGVDELGLDRAIEIMLDRPLGGAEADTDGTSVGSAARAARRTMPPSVVPEPAPRRSRQPLG